MSSHEWCLFDVLSRTAKRDALISPLILGVPGLQCQPPQPERVMGLAQHQMVVCLASSYGMGHMWVMVHSCAATDSRHP
jgi:hypothetical protein